MFNPPNLKKFKKKHKYSINGFYLKNKLYRGIYGLKAIENGYLNYKQIEAARKAMIKNIKKIAKIYINIKPNLGVTNKPAETRMGKGKGNIIDWVFPVKSGKILFELKSLNILKNNFLTERKAREVLLLGSAKLSLKTIFKKY